VLNNNICVEECPTDSIANDEGVCAKCSEENPCAVFTAPVSTGAELLETTTKNTIVTRFVAVDADTTLRDAGKHGSFTYTLKNIVQETPPINLVSIAVETDKVGHLETNPNAAFTVDGTGLCFPEATVFSFDGVSGGVVEVVAENEPLPTSFSVASVLKPANDTRVESGYLWSVTPPVSSVRVFSLLLFVAQPGERPTLHIIYQTSDAGTRVIETDVTLNPGVWQTLLVSVNQTSQRVHVYVDFVLKATASLSAALTTYDKVQFHIGQRSKRNDNHQFTGALLDQMWYFRDSFVQGWPTSSSLQSLFSLDETSGELALKQQVDREKNTSFVYQVTAQNDVRFATITTAICVLDEVMIICTFVTTHVHF
jgi:hypothetical protein